MARDRFGARVMEQFESMGAGAGAGSGSARLGGCSGMRLCVAGTETARCWTLRARSWLRVSLAGSSGAAARGRARRRRGLEIGGGGLEHRDLHMGSLHYHLRDLTGRRHRRETGCDGRGARASRSRKPELELEHGARGCLLWLLSSLLLSLSLLLSSSSR